MKEVEPEIQQAMDNIAARKLLIKQREKVKAKAKKSVKTEVKFRPRPAYSPIHDEDEFTYSRDKETQDWLKTTSIYENYQAIKDQDSWD